MPQNSSTRAQRLARFFWILMLLFCLRVLGQMLVAFGGVTFLPPMEAWYSGLIPYPVLLPLQLLIIGLLAKVCCDFTRGQGFFVRPRPAFRSGALYFGYAYLLAMILRYVIHMGLHPEARWLGGTIPIFFHWVLACFVIMFGCYHRAVSIKQGSVQSRVGLV